MTVANIKKAGAAGALLTLGAIAGAFSKWYLVWWAQRVGGAELLGLYSILLAFGTPLFVAAQLGLRTLFLSKLTAYPWRTYLILRLGGLTVGSLVFLLIGFAVPGISFSLVLSVLALKIFDSIIDLDLARIQYSGKILKVGFLTLAGAVLALFFSTIGVLLPGSLSSAVAGAAGASCLVAILAGRAARKTPYTEASDFSGIGDILRSSIPVTGAQILASFLTYLPVLFLSVLSTPAVVGIYSGAAYILTAANLVGSSISKLLITPLRKIRDIAGNIAVFQRVNTLCVQVAAVGILAGVIFILFGSPFFQWLYGPEFILPPLVLFLLAVASVFIVLSYLHSVGLNILNRYHQVNISFVASCLMAVVTGIVIFSFSMDTLMAAAAMAAAGAATRSFMMMIVTQYTLREER